MYKVSIVVPAYQAENYVQKYIDQVLAFDYKNIELIIVNDASTDKTHEIIELNRKKIEDAGIEFKYVNLLENKGQANAIDVGLKLVTGDYLSWQDVDDIYFPNCISRSLEILLENPECKMVYSKALMRDGRTQKLIMTNQVPATLPRAAYIHENLFVDYIWCKNVIFAPLRFVETKALFEALKDKSIYTGRGGQNWQLLLPMSYHYKWIYIDEVLSEYVVYQNSHSHCATPKFYRKQHIAILTNTIKRLKISIFEKIYYILMVRYRFLTMDLKDLKNDFRQTIKLKRKQ